jgi:aquacobalamin reductase/NAD(P)H-flavin reductase
MKTYLCSLVSQQKLNHDVYHFCLRPHQPMPVRAGQYLEVVLDNGWCVPYSIANMPGDDGVVEMFIQDVGGPAVTQVITKLTQSSEATLAYAGEVVTQPDWENKPLVLLVAGCGLSQARALIQQRLASDSSAPIYLCWGGCGANELFAWPELELWQQDPRFLYNLALENPPKDWAYGTGYVVDVALNDLSSTKLSATGLAAFLQAHVAITGSPLMTKATTASLISAGFSADHIHADLDFYQRRTLDSNK